MRLRNGSQDNCTCYYAKIEVTERGRGGGWGVQTWYLTQPQLTVRGGQSSTDLVKPAARQGRFYLTFSKLLM